MTEQIGTEKSLPSTKVAFDNDYQTWLISSFRTVFPTLIPLNQISLQQKVATEFKIPHARSS